MSEQNLDELYEQAVDTIQNGKKKGVFEVIKKAFSQLNNDLNNFYDFVGKIFLIDPDFFNNKCLESYYKGIDKILNTNQIMTMELQILQDNCFYSGEQLITMSPGVIRIGTGRHIGRIYVTNYRLICIGVIKGDSVVFNGLLDRVIDKAMNKSELKGLQRRLGEASNQDLPCLGSQYPIFGVEKLKPKKDTLFYTSKIPTKKGTKKYAFIVAPLTRTPNEFIQKLTAAIEGANN